MLMAPLVTTGVSDDVAQELQMLIGPQTLDDVEEPMQSFLQHSKIQTFLIESWLDQHSLGMVPDVRRISRT